MPTRRLCTCVSFRLVSESDSYAPLLPGRSGRDGDILTGYAVRLVPTQIRRGRTYLDRLNHALLRVLGLLLLDEEITFGVHLLLGDVGEPFGSECSLHPSRADRVGGYKGFRAFLCERLGEPDNRRLAPAVRG